MVRSLHGSDYRVGIHLPRSKAEDALWAPTVRVSVGVVIFVNVLKATWRVSLDMGTECARWEDEYTMRGRLGLRGNISLH